MEYLHSSSFFSYRNKPFFLVLKQSFRGNSLTNTVGKEKCEPCTFCYRQNNPIFDPSKSSTYKVGHRDKGSKGDFKIHCPYEIIYDDMGYSVGTVRAETFTLPSTSGEPFVMQDVALGCGNNNSELSPLETGIYGLGRGPTSLISQMGDSIQCLFSYRLGTGTSKINLGANAIVSGDGVSSTNLYTKHSDPYAYYLNLEAISIDGVRVETSGTSLHAKDGDIVIDSGSTFTYLPEDYFLRLTEALDKAMHFTDVDLVLDRENTYFTYFTTDKEGVICFAFAQDSSSSEQPRPAVLGNIF